MCSLKKSYLVMAVILFIFAVLDLIIMDKTFRIYYWTRHAGSEPWVDIKV